MTFKKRLVEYIDLRKTKILFLLNKYMKLLILLFIIKILKYLVK